MTEKIIGKAVSQYVNQPTSPIVDSNDEIINFLVKLIIPSTFRDDEKVLRTIIDQYVKTTSENSSIKLKAYYQPYKLSSSFSNRPTKPPADRSHVVYTFNCSEPGCNASYIGYTAQRLITRAKQHRYSSSSIHSHFEQDHSISPPPIDSFINSFSIIYSSNNVISLKIVEAINIKQINPIVNVKYNENRSFLLLF